MDVQTILILVGLMGAAAALYASVGHAGASAYLGIMALAGLAPDIMRPTALTLNIVVAGIVSWRFVRAGWFSLPVLWPFLVTSIPLAFLGGALHLPADYYRPLVGLVLWFAAFQLFFPSRIRDAAEDARPPLIPALAAGAVLGLLSGLTGVGGGIFLSPLLIGLGWAATRKVAGVAGVFILLNSLAGLGGNVAAVARLPVETPYLALAVITGAMLGTTFSLGRATRAILLRANALVLALAGAKFIFL
ncbi:MAG: sulfite exporter TauE/SafE family protein [Alphaproteobacteria bacterium]|nr:sulfite exporter TauE/SafE family protein [Alphaproteobacteria bacterium]